MDSVQNFRGNENFFCLEMRVASCLNEMVMRVFRILFLAAVAAIFSGCEKQAKLNNEKLDQLAARLAQQEMVQSNKMLLIQAQLALLAPQLDKEASEYFEKNRDAALFFHTNTLYLLLNIDKHIETQLEKAELERAGISNAMFSYHTNQISTTLYGVAQVEETTQDQLNKLEERLNAEAARLSHTTSNALMQEIIRPAELTTNEIAWRKEMQDTLAAIRRELESLKARLPAPPTNLPIAP